MNSFVELIDAHNHKARIFLCFLSSSIRNIFITNSNYIKYTYCVMNVKSQNSHPRTTRLCSVYLHTVASDTSEEASQKRCSQTYNATRIECTHLITWSHKGTETAVQHHAVNLRIHIVHSHLQTTNQTKRRRRRPCCNFEIPHTVDAVNTWCLLFIQNWR